MEQRPDVPLIIMRKRDLTYNEKSFLLWCWICRDDDKKCDLIVSNEYKLSKRTIQWYADYFGIPKQTMHDVFTSLKRKGIMKTKHDDVVGEITYINFSVFC